MLWMWNPWWWLRSPSRREADPEHKPSPSADNVIDIRKWRRRGAPYPHQEGVMTYFIARPLTSAAAPRHGAIIPARGQIVAHASRVTPSNTEEAAH